MRRYLLLAGMLTLIPVGLSAQSREDSLAIRATAEDYVFGWYDGDAARMERAVHPDLAKRNVSSPAQGRSRVNNMSAMSLVQVTRNRASSPQPSDRRMFEVQILTIDGDIAAARVVSWDFIDLVHMGRVDGRWVIINDVWTGRPQ